MFALAAAGGVLLSAEEKAKLQAVMWPHGKLAAAMTAQDAPRIAGLAGLEREALHAVFDTFCEDLLSSKQLAWADNCPVDVYTLAELMREIDDPALQRKVLDLCVRLAEVDGHVAAGESIVLVAAVEHWGLHRHMLRRYGAMLSQRSG
jgi:tellurite resistance protein